MAQAEASPKSNCGDFERDLNQLVADEYEFRHSWQERHADVLARHPHLRQRAAHPVPREQREGTYCEDYELDGCPVQGCPQSCYHNRGVVCTSSVCRCEGQIGTGNPITLCKRCGLAIYACSERPTGWAHFRTMGHRAEPSPWLREDW